MAIYGWSSEIGSYGETECEDEEGGVNGGELGLRRFLGASVMARPGL